ARAPAREYDQPVLDSDQVEEVHGEPGQPGDEAAELDAGQIGHSLRLTDRRQIPLVVVAERPAVTPLQSLPYDAPRIATLLHRNRRDSRESCKLPVAAANRDHVPDREHLRMPGEGQLGLYLQPPGAVDAAARGVRQQPGER